MKRYRSHFHQTNPDFLRWLANEHGKELIRLRQLRNEVCKANGSVRFFVLATCRFASEGEILSRIDSEHRKVGQEIDRIMKYLDSLDASRSTEPATANA